MDAWRCLVIVMYRYWLILMAGLYVLATTSCVVIVMGNRVMARWRKKHP